MDIRVVVSAKLLLFLGGEASERLLNVAIGVLAADHEANLARRIGGDRGIRIFDGREDGLAVLLELGDEREVEPLVLGCF